MPRRNMAQERPAFDLSQFEVMKPLGLIGTRKADDEDEEGDGEMTDFTFETDYVAPEDVVQIDARTKGRVKSEKESADDAKKYLVSSTVMDMARNKTEELGLATTIEDKIEKWRGSWERRMAKQTEEREREEDKKWEGYMKAIIEKQKEVERKEMEDEPLTVFKDCGDRLSSFGQLGVSRVLLRGIQEHLHWTHPTPVQRETIPLALAAHDLLINAVTGSGKSGAFIIPIIQRLMFSETNELNERRVLVIGPTRELAIQIHEVFKVFVDYLKSLRASSRMALSLCAPLIGGVRPEIQRDYINSHQCDIMVATPGRLVDLMHNYFNNATNAAQLLFNVEILVLDEADRLLDMGFQPQLFEIFQHLSPKEYRQNILCSATLSDSVSKLVDISLNTENMKKVAVDPALALNTGKLTQEFIRLHDGQGQYKMAMVFALLLTTFRDKKAIIFCRTKSQAHTMRIVGGFFGIRCVELHGNMSQFERIKSLERFKGDESMKFMFCTDVAARGIDIDDVQLIINQEFPTSVTTYIHRVGRTARAGRRGYACTFVADSRKKLLKKLIMSNTNRRGVMRSRTLNHEFVLWMHRRIANMQNEIRPLLKLETKERDLRLMAIKLQKAENMYKHRKEIQMKDEKTWITKDEDKAALRKEAQRKKLGAEEVKKLMTRDQIEAKKEKEREKLEVRQVMKEGKRIKAKKRKERNAINKTKSGNDDSMADALDMIKQPWKYKGKGLETKQWREYESKAKKKSRFSVKKEHGGGFGNNSKNNKRLTKKFQKKRLRKKMGKKRH